MAKPKDTDSDTSNPFLGFVNPALPESAAAPMRAEKVIPEGDQMVQLSARVRRRVRRRLSDYAKAHELSMQDVLEQLILEHLPET